MQATITWRPASKPPKHTRRVLVAQVHDDGTPITEPVEAGFYVRKRWYDESSLPIEIYGVVVTHWAEMPAHPEQK